MKMARVKYIELYAASDCSHVSCDTQIPYAICRQSYWLRILDHDASTQIYAYIQGIVISRANCNSGDVRTNFSFASTYSFFVQNEEVANRFIWKYDSALRRVLILIVKFHLSLFHLYAIMLGISTVSVSNLWTVAPGIELLPSKNDFVFVWAMCEWEIFVKNKFNELTGQWIVNSNCNYNKYLLYKNLKVTRAQVLRYNVFYRLTCRGCGSCLWSNWLCKKLRVSLHD